MSDYSQTKIEIINIIREGRLSKERARDRIYDLWLEKPRYKALREKWMFEIPGLEVMWVVTTNLDGKPLGDLELRALELKLILEHPYTLTQPRPRFNSDPRDIDAAKRIIEREWGPELQRLFEDCQKRMLDFTANWHDCRKGSPDPEGRLQGIYVFRDRNTKRVKDGYVGKANPEVGKGTSTLKSRIREHFTDDPISDNLLKAYAQEETDMMVREMFPELPSKEEIERRNFGRVQEILEVPNLTEIQTRKYEEFLQLDAEPAKRKATGLESVLREVFPITSYDGSLRLDYVCYRLGRPRYTPDQCRALRLTYARPFRVTVRLSGQACAEPIEEEVYVGELPIMMGGGEFIINGAERVIVSQMHRSPGVDFSMKLEAGDRRLHSCRIIPERGSWIEMNVSKKDVLQMRIDQSSKIPVTAFLRAMNAKFADTETLIRLFYETKSLKMGSIKPGTPMQDMYVASPLVNKDTGEVILAAGERIGEKWDTIRNSSIKQLEVVADPQCDPLLLNTLGEDKTSNYDEAILYIYGRLRVGNPPNLDKAKQLFAEKFYDVNRYRLGRVGRFRLNRKFGTKVPEDEMTLRPEDFIECIRYVMRLRQGEGYVDDIDDLGNRRLRTIDELAGDEIRKGFLKLRRTVQERMSLKDPKELTPRTLVNSKSVSSSIEFFFGRSELSQVVDQTNPLAQLANERRLSALGPGGLNRKRAGFEVRDVHVSHYGRICPIETPEGTNIGLIAQLGIYATVDPYGFLITPYRKVEKGQILSGGNGDGKRDSDNEQNQARELLNAEDYPYPPGIPQKAMQDLRLLHAAKITEACKQGHLARETRIGIFESIRKKVQSVLNEKGGTWNNKDFKKRYFQEEPGFQVAWVKTTGTDGKPLGSTDLQLVEAAFLRDYASRDHSDDDKFPRLNNSRGKKGDMSEEALKAYLKCQAELAKANWIPIKDAKTLDLTLKKIMWSPEDIKNLSESEIESGPQGLYFFQPVGEDLNSGYIGISGKVKADDPEAKGLIKRMHEHAWTGDWGPRSESSGQYSGTDNTFIESIIADWEFRAIERFFESELRRKARKLERGKLDSAVRYMRADEEMQHTLAPADIPTDAHGRITADAVVARVKGDFRRIPSDEVEYVDISPKQLVGVSASLIPFLEHDDANRALMGSNMQRQAVPLLAPQPPIVATGMEKPVAENSGMVVRAAEAGEVTYVDANRIVVRNRDGWETEYVLRKFVGLNERTCLNQKPIVTMGQKVKRHEVIADGPGISQGELALGRDVVVAFVTWDGYNFEDAILVSESFLKDDRFTSIHIDEFDVEVRETKLGREEFTRDIPNVSERQLRNLDEQGMICVGTRVGPGDILVGKISPKSKTELSPEEKLLHAIFGRAGEDVKNDSLVVPAGTEGIVISAEKYSRVAHLSDTERRRRSREARRIEKEMNEKIIAAFRALAEKLNALLHTRITDPVTGAEYGKSTDEVVLLEQIEKFDYERLETRSQSFDEGREVVRREWPKIQELMDDKERQVARLRRGDELPTGVLEMVKIWIATKRTLAVGDKMAGRHGNKGVIARILPVEDMPFLPDGRPVEILLNPLGVPSRMNVGQILETHLGWAAAVLGFQAITPVFDGCKEDTIHDLLEQAGLPRDGKTVLHDGRTGEPFDQRVTVGHIYMMKLHHLVDDKIHARATGPYSLITQQPLGGKARSGGQRFGEMEVWALEAYGAAYILQELLTVKSDDVEGRTKIYESMVMGRNTLEAGTPVSFDVLCNEIKGLCLNVQLEKKRL